MTCGGSGPASAPPSERTSATRNSSPRAVDPETQTASATSGASARDLPIDALPSEDAVAPEIIGIDAARARPAVVPPPVGVAEQSPPGRQPRSRRHSPGRRWRAAVVIGPAGRPLAFAE